jgi:hypothetical protein
MIKNGAILILILILATSNRNVKAQNLEKFKYSGEEIQVSENTIRNEYQFNGYTNYWHDTYTNWYRYGDLFKMAVPDVQKTILQSKVDAAEDMGVPGFLMQEGFVSGLLSNKFSTLTNPSIEEVERNLENENLLIYVNSKSEVGTKVRDQLPADFNWPKKLKSHQYGAPDLKRVNAFILENGNRKIFAVCSEDDHTLNLIKQQIDNALNVLKKYDLHKGWFGSYTLLNSVTCTKGHPIEVMGTGMNEGCSWFVFEGYMDFMSKDDIARWVKEVNLPVVTDVGATRVYGCKDYDGFQIQQMYDTKSWVDFARKKDGYVFRAVWDTLSDPYHFDGYIATEGNKEQIDKEDVPFVLKTGMLSENALSSMVLFLEKGKQLTRESMWNAILDRREAGILARGKMMGPAMYRNALQMLLLDRVFLEEYFDDRIDLQAVTKDYDLQVIISNDTKASVSGTVELGLPAGLNVKGKSSVSIKLEPGSSIIQHFTLQPSSKVMDNTNPVAVHFKWNGKKKSTLTMLDLPPAISVHRLLYGHTPEVKYPVTIHNFTNESSFPVKIQVIDIQHNNKVVYDASQTCKTSTGTFKDMLFTLDVPAGNYKVKVSALGVDYTSQLGVGAAKGAPYVYPIDLNGDGVMEYRMENDSVQITLLAIGARVIEYIVKSRNDNIFFKNWPNKAIDDKRPFRKRGYYPFGGFEDFLGQASMETHQVYNAEIVKKEGDFVRVKMWTDYFGNRLEKTFTLYGDSPLLEVRFALDFKNPEANMLGPQPILELGKKHWTEDKFIIPTVNGLHEARMKPEKYFGQAFQVKEGWNAGYDTKEDITFIGAFPVDQPLFLHMWQNHPDNKDAHHYYAEFQPWLPIFQKSTMYFSYYIWGAGGPWKNSLKALKEMNLITTR